jgi:hypothetical protein
MSDIEFKVEVTLSGFVTLHLPKDKVKKMVAEYDDGEEIEFEESVSKTILAAAKNFDIHISDIEVDDDKLDDDDDDKLDDDDDDKLEEDKE